MWRHWWQNFNAEDSVRVTEPIALELVEHVSQIEDLGNLQNFGEEISGIRPECERWTELGQERAEHHD
jgi:hypothetical protein